MNMSNFLTAKWENIIMVNYAIDPNILQNYIPKGVEIDTFNGKNYVSLVGFMFKNTSIFNIPIPLLGTFEEINLRFYVKRTVNGKIRKGVVFINETVPYKIVALLANFLYKEHYISIPTKSNIQEYSDYKNVKFEWKKDNHWNSISLKANIQAQKIEVNTIEEFIYEHYFGYTKVDNETTLEYEILHPSWQTNTVLEAKIQCNFASMYGNDFEVLSYMNPENVMIAKGSNIAVKWKINKI